MIENLLDLAELPADKIPTSTLELARFSLFDWLVVGTAGVDEPLAKILRAMAEAEGGTPASSVFGMGKAPIRMAALVNGATSHALDYDDTHFAHIGHLSVGIYPAALAVAEAEDASADALIGAFFLGAEAAIRVGTVLDRSHYLKGFHQTATAGAFGATIAASRLMELNRHQTKMALGLCATRASGLRSQFGTMGKPYNAGIAASNGVECAQLAALGFTSCEDAFLGEQGFIQTHSDEPNLHHSLTNWAIDNFLFEDNKYKLHACCHGLHAAIEALIIAKEETVISIDQIEKIELRTNTRWLSVCDIKTPRTGLEVKFSYNWLMGMVLSELQTANDRIYTDELAGNSKLLEIAKLVSVVADDALTDMQVAGFIRLKEGNQIALSYDLNQKLSNEKLETGLRNKAHAILGERSKKIWSIVCDSNSAREIGQILNGKIS